MRRRWLHEAAKFGAGLIAADFLMLVWLSQQAHYIPASFLGVRITADMLGPTLILDIFLFLMLIHYGWNIGKLPRVKERMYLLTAGTIFAIIAIAHFVRIFVGADIVIAGWGVPELLSWVGIAVTTYLAYASFHLAMRMK